MILVCVSPHILVPDCVRWCNSDQVPSGPTGVFVQLNHSLSPTWCLLSFVSAQNVTFTGMFQVQYKIQQAEWPWTLSTAEPWNTFICMEIISYCDANFVNRHLPNQEKLSWEQMGYWRSHTHKDKCVCENAKTFNGLCAMRDVHYRLLRVPVRET